jgi:caffeoyl-CoA O-methyltransferase
MRKDVAGWLRELADIPSDPVLEEMHRVAEAGAFPIVGPEVGRLLAQLVRLTGASQVFEMGSGFGYSTLWIARALPEGGRVIHTDTDPANTALARDFLLWAGVLDRVAFLNGDACALLAESDDSYDLLLCDVDKEQYPHAYQTMRPRVRRGGVIVADNLLWSGRVAAGESDPATSGVREYIRLMWGDPAFLSSLLPMRDGVGVSVRVA